MPRLSNRRYLAHCRFLRATWLKHDMLYGLLPINAQWDLHAFYKPDEELTDQQRLAHREHVTSERPALPARAGRSFNQIYRSFEQARDRAMLRQPAHQPKRRDRQIRVYGIARPEPDLKLLARALVQSAIEQALDSKRG